MRSLLRTNIDVNWKNHKARYHTALHISCDRGHDAVVSLLLAHRPGLHVNKRNNYGCTPFFLCCLNGHSNSARLLLRDPRVDLNLPNHYGFTPLRQIALKGHAEVCKWMVASGRMMDFGQPGNTRTDPFIATHDEVQEILRRFRDDPEGTRQQVRIEVGWYEELAAEFFAMVVFLCDGLLEVKEPADSVTGAMAAERRFMGIARRLPMELQMVLCHRIVGSGRNNVSGKHSEAAFRNLAIRASD